MVDLPADCAGAAEDVVTLGRRGGAIIAALPWVIVDSVLLGIGLAQGTSLTTAAPQVIG